MDAKLKYLELIQAVITRMANNSFLLKGWNVSLVTAIIALTSASSIRWFVLLAILPALMFWGLDAYFLQHERMYRKLYNHARQLEVDKVDFNLNAEMYRAHVDNWCCTACKGSLLAFHGVIILVVLAAAFWWFCHR